MEIQGKILNSFDEADKIIEENSKYVGFEVGKKKMLKFSNWNLVSNKNPLTGLEEVEFIGTVIEEDGKQVQKVLQKSSKRLYKALKDVLKNKSFTESVTLSITQVGEGFDTNYLVELAPQTTT